MHKQIITHWSRMTASIKLLCALSGVAFYFLAADRSDAQAEAETFDFTFINAPIAETILPLYEDLTGKKLIFDGSIAQAQVTITARRPLAAEEAIPFIEATLLMNGFAIVPVDERTAKVVNAQSKPIPMISQLPVYISEADLPEEEVFVAYVMRLTYVQPEEAQRIFQLVARSNALLGGAVTPVPDANSVIITDLTPVIRTLIELKKQIDVPPSEIKMKAILLERADAQEVATALTEIISQQNTAKSGGSAGRSSNARASAAAIPTLSQPPAGGNAVAAPSAGTTAPDGNTVQIQAISRTNSVLVIARPIDFTYIEKLIDIFDAPSQVDNFLKVELKYLSVSDFMPIAADALSRNLESGATGGSAGAGGAGSRTTNRATTQVNGNSTGNSRNSLGGTGGGSAGGGIGGAGSNLQSPQELGGPESLIVGNTLLIGDSQLNNIIVSGPPEHRRLIEQLLEEIDIRPRQVYITAIIAQVSLGDDIRSGFDLLRRVDDIKIGNENVNIAGLYRTSGDGVSIIDPLDLELVSEFPIAAASGLNVWAQVGSFLNSYVQALENTNRFEVISRPFVFTANNQRADISSGQRVAVPTQSISSVTNNDTVNSSIGFEEVVLQLEVIPLINSKDEVTLTIAQQNENITGFTTISNNSVPNIATQKLNTTVRLPNKGIVVLGGIIQEQESKNTDGLPFISRVPILKLLTGTNSKTKDRSELLIFLQPHIIEGGDDLIDANVRAVSGTIIGEDALQSAAPTPDQHPALFPEAKKKGGLNFFKSKEEHADPASREAPPAGTLEFEAKEANERKSGLSRIFSFGTKKDTVSEASKEKNQPKGLFKRRK
jgi:general secretion pathway protein D